MAKPYNNKVRLREFSQRDLVLRKILPIQEASQGKWAPHYKGPYIVKKLFSTGGLFLTHMDWDELPCLVNADSIKKYYAWYIVKNVFINESSFLAF